MFVRAASALIAVLAGLSFVCSAADEGVPNTEGSKDGVTVRVFCPKSFASDREVAITYSVVNQSDGAYRMMYAHEFHDIRVELIGPNGGKIAGYRDKNGWIEWALFKRRIIVDLERGMQHQGDQVNLADAWPLKEVGEYRCRLTKRIYRADKKRFSGDDLGVPVEIEVPEFSFRVESVDPIFKPLYGPEPELAVKRPALVEDKVMPAWRWAVCVGGVLGLAWIFLKK